MLKRRQESMATKARAEAPVARPPEPDRTSVLEQRMSDGVVARPAAAAPHMPAAVASAANPLRDPPALHDSVPMRAEAPAANNAQDIARARRDQADMMSELRSVKGLIEQRFDALAFIEKLQRQPSQARLTQKLLDCGLSPALIRKLSDSLPADVGDETEWASVVLERNLMTAEAESPLEDVGGVFALIGATGVGKTTTTAKIAAAFATKYGAANLGLITLDAYRVAAHEQLRAYGRILGVPVHTAHDRASLEDLLELLAGKKMVLIDTAGMAQRDTRTRELLDMLSHRSIQRLLVVNSASQGETIEDVIVAYRATTCKGVVLSKMDEAVKLGPAIDALIRHKLKVIGVANGQRVPEDWHRLTASALVQRALRGGGSTAYKMDASDVSLVFAAPHAQNASQLAQHA
jgi:flagellar biosynthesis protein FlhF